MLLICSISLRVLQNDGFLPLDTGKIQRRLCSHQPSPKASADEFLEGAAVILVAMTQKQIFRPRQKIRIHLRIRIRICVHNAAVQHIIPFLLRLRRAFQVLNRKTAILRGA